MAGRFLSTLHLDGHLSSSFDLDPIDPNIL